MHLTFNILPCNFLTILRVVAGRMSEKGKESNTEKEDAQTPVNISPVNFNHFKFNPTYDSDSEHTST